MTKLVQNDIASLTNEQSALAALNSNYASLELFSDTVLSRDGVTPNEMLADFDMNSNRILNLPEPLTANEPLRLQDLADFIGGTLTIPTPGGSQFQVQYNAGGSPATFGGDAGLTYNPTTDLLTGVDGVFTSGLVIGFSGTPVADVIEVGDANFQLTFGAGTTPAVIFDSTDLFRYTRSTNTFDWAIGNVSKLGINIAAVFPGSNDGLTLGTTTNQFSDLFLASGGVINWNNGDVLLTHAANVLAFTGASSGYSFDTNVAVTGSVIATGAASAFQVTRRDTNANAWVIYSSAGNLTFFSNADTADKLVLTTTVLQPSTNDLIALGTATASFSDLFLASGGVINFNNGDILITHAANNLIFSGASTGYAFDALVFPSTNNTVALGNTAQQWSDLFLGDGAVINFNNGNYTLTHASGKLTASADIKGITESFVISASDETTALTTGTGKVTFRMPYALTVTDVRGSLSTAQTSGSIFTVDVNDSGTTILSTKLTIDNTEKTSTTAATARVISDTALADDAEISIDIDQVGDGTAKGLKVIITGFRP